VQLIRFGGYFLETWCAVLFHDSLRNPSKHPHNMEYVRMVLRILDNMVPGEPISTAKQSLLRIQQAVERSISGPSGDITVQLSPDITSFPHGRTDRNIPSVQFPSLYNNLTGSASDLIYFTDRNHTSESTFNNHDVGFGSDSIPSAESLWLSNYDVLTTDLFSFFPT
jgi:DUF4097 and DUF4098 domain-containing protein YvlB